jgi:hypothetical protein
VVWWHGELNFCRLEYTDHNGVRKYFKQGRSNEYVGITFVKNHRKYVD